MGSLGNAELCHALSCCFRAYLWPWEGNKTFVFSWFSLIKEIIISIYCATISTFYVFNKDQPITISSDRYVWRGFVKKLLLTLLLV